MKTLILLASIVFTVGCTQSPEQHLVHLLETRYANLHVNRPDDKLKVIAKLKTHLDKHALNSENFAGIQTILRELNDGHVQLTDTTDQNPQLESGLKFHFGTNRIRSCEGCEPNLDEGDYTILKVNGQLAQDWVRSQQHAVSASTPWGRDYRIWRLLEFSNIDTPLTLELQDANRKIITVSPHWTLRNPEEAGRCVIGKRLTEASYQLIIKSLWCQTPTEYARRDVLKRFRAQWEEAIAPIRFSDKIILDLRENSGGGDEETVHVLSTFIDRPVPLYHYKYLQTTRPGFMRFIVQATRSLWPLWTEDKKQDLNPTHVGKTLPKNEMDVLIGAGCFSSCEVIADVLRNAKRGTLIGSTTHGGAGEPRDVPIKGSAYVLTLPTCLVWKTNGRPYEGEGISPSADYSSMSSKN